MAQVFFKARRFRGEAQRSTDDKLAGRAFDALSAAEKRKIIGQIEAAPAGAIWRKAKLK